MTCTTYSAVTPRGLRGLRVEAEEAFLERLSAPPSPERASTPRGTARALKALRLRNITESTHPTPTQSSSKHTAISVETSVEVSGKEVARRQRLSRLLSSVRAWLHSLSPFGAVRPPQQEKFSLPEIMVPDGVPAWIVPAVSFHEPDRRDEMERLRDPFPRVPQYSGSPPWTTRYHPDLVRRPRLSEDFHRDDQ